MPVYYHFKTLDGKTVELATVDELLCQKFSHPCSPTQYSMLFNMLTVAGDYAVRTGKFCQDDFDTIMKKSEMTPEQVAIFQDFIHGTYFYHSWR